MGSVKFLSRKDAKPIIAQVNDQWGADISSFLDRFFFLRRKDDINVISRDVASFDFSALRVNRVGLYFCEEYRGIRLSIEGSQLVGPLATKNVLEIDDSQLQLWLKGEDVFLEADVEGMVLVKHGQDFVGCGKYSEGKLFNFVPKTRRLPASAFEP